MTFHEKPLCLPSIQELLDGASPDQSRTIHRRHLSDSLGILPKPQALHPDITLHILPLEIKSLSLSQEHYQRSFSERPIAKHTSPPPSLSCRTEVTRPPPIITLNLRDDDPKKYSCPYCQKRFMRPSSLRIHTYSHTGEKPFECTEKGCGRKFSVQSNMRRHLRVHRLMK
ncbi:hypothetical protein EC973_009283 [Apophysomyces ossiformis]|uniref:C2H2-type domain-containing protein n=1 Tax=Apophysomyces ossiformis TaxID=679940 RepID=A0A8H7BSA0_9FUNG|nr:hypothetical protein EC973_009283 [Apophysomyces ossiformis]